MHRVIKKYGLLYLLKKGLAVNNAKFIFFYPQPNGSSAKIEKSFEPYYTTLSPIIDNVAYRFNQELELEDEQKADFKIKAKQWESLFWFLNFLIPKLQVKNRELDALDALLDSVDLSTYGLERVKLGCSNVGYFEEVVSGFSLKHYKIYV